MLKLRTPLTILCNSSPLIRPLLVLVRALVYHRLNREDVAWFHCAGDFVGGVVWDGGVSVEEFAYAVAAEGFIYREGGLVLGCYAGYCRAQVTVECTGFDYHVVSSTWGRMVVWGEEVPCRIACFRHSREQFTRDRPTSSTFPIRYVSLRSACNPP